MCWSKATAMLSAVDAAADYSFVKLLDSIDWATFLVFAACSLMVSKPPPQLHSFTHSLTHSLTHSKALTKTITLMELVIC